MPNDFSSDSHCVALYSLESGALMTDSVGGNTLNNSGVVADTVNYQEGAASGDFEKDTPSYMYCADGDLDADFPHKVGTENDQISVCMWIKPESIDPVANWLYCKWDNFLNVQDRTLCFGIYGGNLRLYISYNSGLNTEYQSFSSRTIAAGTWYHVAFTHDDTTKAWRIRVYDASNTTVYDESGTFTNSGLTFFNVPMQLGVQGANAAYPYDGLMDEVVIFNDILSAEEIDEIRAGSYGSSSSSSSASWSSSSSSSLSSSSSYSSSSSFVPLDWPRLTRAYDLEILELPADRDIAARVGAGKDTVRPRFTRKRRRWQLGIRLMELADLLILEHFYLVDCRRSVKTFNFTHPKMEQTWLVRFDPAAPPRFRTEQRQPNEHAFEATFLEDTAGTYGPGGYGHLYYPSG